MTNIHKAEFSTIVSRTSVDEAIHDALHKCVGHGRKVSVKQLQRDSGVNARMIGAAMAAVEDVEFRRLARENFWSIARVLGAGFLNELLPQLAHQGAFDLPDEALPHPGAVAADSAEDHAVIAVAAADGRFCANDHRKLWLVGKDYIERGMQLVGLGKHRRAA